MCVKVKTLFYSNAGGKFPYTWYAFKSKAKKHKYAYEKPNRFLVFYKLTNMFVVTLRCETNSVVALLYS